MGCAEENARDAKKVRDELMFMKKSPGVELRVDATTGELMVKTKTLMKRYFGAPEKTAEAMTDDGFYRMGDTIVHDGTVDDDDEMRFQVMSRQKNVIITAEGYAFAQYIEDALMEHEGVSGAVVVGADKHGSTYKLPVAFVTTHEEMERNEKYVLVDALMSMVARQRSEHEVPAHVFVLDSIPKGGVGKVDRTALTEMANHYLNDIERVAEEKISGADHMMAFEFQRLQLQRQSSQ